MAYRLHRQARSVAGLACAILLLMLALPAGSVRAAPLVTTCADNGTGSLRAAIAATASGGTIQFLAGLNCPSTSPILLTGGTLTLATNLTIDGTGATIAVDGNNAGNVFTVNSGTNVTINALTIQHGQQVGGGGIGNSGTLAVTKSTFSGNSATDGGGGIANGGMLVVTNSTFSGNRASHQGGGIANGFGGKSTVTNSTFIGNTAIQGGGIANGGTLVVTNSTFSGNSASGGGANQNDGGGIFSELNNSDTLTVTSSTFSGNSATDDGGGIHSSSFSGPVTLTNVIVANSPAGGDLGGGGFGGFGGNNNLIDDGSGTLTGTGNIRNTPALLGTLGNNGGPTQTIPLLPGSPAIDAGAAVGSGPAGNPVPATDQRGLPRFGAPDIGAFEVRAMPNPLPPPQPPGPHLGVPAPLPGPPRPSGPPLGVPAPLPSRRP